MSICRKCAREYIYNRKNGSRLDVCNSCRTRKVRKTKKIKLLELAGGKCVLCGYNKRNEVLCFHHKDPQDKAFGIAENFNRKLEDLIKEIDKCILVCANCHIEIHSRLADERHRAA